MPQPSTWYSRNKDKSKAAARRWRSANPERFRVQHRRAEYKRLYDLTLEEYAAILTKQKGRCAICSTTNPGLRSWHVDHCHKTRQVRGLLCMNCNHLLGRAKDDPTILGRAIEYLTQGRVT